MQPQAWHDQLIPATVAANMVGESVQVVDNWRRRGHLQPAVDENGQPIKSEDGHHLYSYLAVAQAERRRHQRCSERHCRAHRPTNCPRRPKPAVQASAA